MISKGKYIKFIFKILRQNGAVTDLAVKFVHLKNRLTYSFSSKYNRRENSNSIETSLVKNYNNNRPLGPHKKLCYAPFNNLYFGLNGMVSACCYNRTYLLGTYPENSINEIWQGEKANDLRKFMEQNDLSHGCDKCGEQILSGNHEAVLASTYDYFATDDTNYPTRIDFELSNTCNFECIMCNGGASSSIRKNIEKRPPIPNVYDEQFLIQLDPYIKHLKYTKFLGGEPFLIETYYAIWDKIIAANPGCLINVQTNGSVLNNRVKNILNKGIFTINVSIDSINKINSEKIRQRSNFDTIMANIEYFAEYCKRNGTHLNFCFCPMQSNWQEVPEFINFANKNEALVYFNIVKEPHQQALWTMSYSKLTEVYNYLSAYQHTENSYKEKKNKRHYTDFVKQLSYWMKEAQKRELEMIKDATKSNDKIREQIMERVMSKAKEMNFKERVIDNTYDYDYLLSQLNQRIEAKDTEQEKKEYLLNILNYNAENLLIELSSYTLRG